MTKSKFVIDKLTKLFEQGLISYKDLSSEIINVLRSKRDEIIFKMKLTSKEETDILIKRVENLEKKIDKLTKLFEQGLISYKDLSSEIINVLRSKRDEIVFKMKLTSKEETEILIKRVENLEKKIDNLEKKSPKKNLQR